MTTPFDRPLSDEEFVLLGELLAGIPEPYEPMEADHLDGYLTALVCLPKRPPVGEWMLRVFDVRSRPEAVLADRRAQQDLEDLVFRRFNSIERDLKAGRPIDPIVYEPDEDDEHETETIAALAPFAAGFWEVMDRWPGLREEDNEALASALIGILRHMPEELAGDLLSMQEQLNEESPFENYDDALGDLAESVARVAEITRGWRRAEKKNGAKGRKGPASGKGRGNVRTARRRKD